MLATERSIWGRRGRGTVAERTADHQAHGPLARHLGHGRGGDEAAVAQHRHPVGDAVDLLHAVADEHHRHAPPAQLVDDREQAVDLARG
jgi:hypothetical protein